MNPREISDVEVAAFAGNRQRKFLEREVSRLEKLLADASLRKRRALRGRLAYHRALLSAVEEKRWQQRQAERAETSR